MEREDSSHERGERGERKKEGGAHRVGGVTGEDTDEDQEIAEWSKSGVINTHSHAVARIPSPWKPTPTLAQHHRSVTLLSRFTQKQFRTSSVRNTDQDDLTRNGMRPIHHRGCQ